jgi:hypothetical protein
VIVIYYIPTWYTILTAVVLTAVIWIGRRRT